MDARTDLAYTYLTCLHENSTLREEDFSTGKTILGIFLAGPIGWAIYRWARSQVDACNKKCGTLAIGDKRNDCMTQCKEKVKQAVMARKKAQQAKMKQK